MSPSMSLGRGIQYPIANKVDLLHCYDVIDGTSITNMRVHISFNECITQLHFVFYNNLSIILMLKISFMQRDSSQNLQTQPQ